MLCFMYEVIVTTHCHPLVCISAHGWSMVKLHLTATLAWVFGSVPDPEQAHFHVQVVKQGCRQFLGYQIKMN